jgi:hypothetical protein
VPNLVEPFFGSGALLLGRPQWRNSDWINDRCRTETVNDLDAFVSNWWRAVAAVPDEVASWADWPVNEADMLARHKALIADTEFRQRLRTDPDYYDVRVAGWWAWGLNIWIGDGWCRHEAEKLPHLGNPGKGINRRLPHLGNPGKGINRRLPHLGDPGKGRSEKILDWFSALAERMRDVRVCCGEWDRVLGDSVTIKHGLTGVFLDPPYESFEGTYAVKSEVTTAVREWAIANGDNPLLRIAVCGYDGQHEFPASWDLVHWKARKGYQSVDEDGGHSGENECVWFNRSCLRQNTLFDFPVAEPEDEPIEVAEAGE